MEVRLPKVSIITVSFNSANTIEDTIRSVLNQTYKNIEYIIIDGGSTDGTLDIIKKYEGNISKWVSEPDNGIYDAMNKGINLASGDIIGIINSDDWYPENTVKDVVEVFLSKNEIDVVHGDLIFCDENGKELYKRYGSENIKKDIHKYMTIFHPTMFVRKDIYNKFGTYNTDYKIAADYEFLLRIINHCKIQYINKNLAFMRLGGISSTKFYECALEYYKIRKKHNISNTFNFFITVRNMSFPYLKVWFDRIGLESIGKFYSKLKHGSKIKFIKRP